MSEYDRLKIGPTPSRVSFSRGLLKYMVEGPVVGRRPTMANNPFTSTPNSASKEGGVPRDEWWSEKLESLERQHKEEMEWQSVRVQHLEQLLDGERRMVDTLSKFAEMSKDYQVARRDTHRTNLETMPMDLDNETMPELVTVDGLREELGRVKVDANTTRSAADVFSSRLGPLKMLVPQSVHKMDKAKNLSGPIQWDKEKVKSGMEELSWYDEYLQQKREGQWDPESRSHKDSGLKSMLSDRSVLSGAVGGSWRTRAANETVSI